MTDIEPGAINTAKILMLSGIGNAEDLRSHGIPVVVDSPEVGENFHDHILHGGCLWASDEAHLPRNSAANAAGFWKSDSSLAAPDPNIVQIEIPYASDVLAEQYNPPPSSWALCAGLVAPTNGCAHRAPR